MFVKMSGPGRLYEKLYHSLREAILTGRYKPGERLPSTRELAKEAGVSRNTAIIAYEQLLAEGYAVGQAGSGTYVATELPDRLLSVTGSDRPVSAHTLKPRLSRYGARIAANPPAYTPDQRRRTNAIRYDFRYGLPSLAEFPHETWRRILARRARLASLRSLRYGESAGYEPLRAALAEYLRQSRAVNCDDDQIVIVNGSQQALDLCARVLLDENDHAIIEEPHYQGSYRVLQAVGARVSAVPVDEDGLDATQLPALAGRPRLIYVTPSHQFPTGAIMPLARRLALLDWAASNEAYVIEDDYDSEYRYNARPVESIQGLDRSERVIYIGTLSKVMFPSLRIGYLVLPKPLIMPFLAAKWLADRHTPILEQEALADFINEGHFERHLRRSRARNAARRQALLDALNEHFPERFEIWGANAGVHLLAWFHNIKESELEKIVMRAEEAGVGIYPITPYYLVPPRRAGLLMGYASMSEREIRAGIKRLATIF